MCIYVCATYSFDAITRQIYIRISPLLFFAADTVVVYYAIILSIIKSTRSDYEWRTWIIRFNIKEQKLKLLNLNGFSFMLWN